jgi:hypothetical protein
MSSKIQINGKTYYTSGNNIIVRDDVIIVDGERLDMPEAKNITIIIEGDLTSLECDMANKIEVHGSTGDVTTSNSKVIVGGDVVGNVKTSNASVTCGNVHGKVKTSNGDIYRRT